MNYYEKTDYYNEVNLSALKIIPNLPTKEVGQSGRNDFHTMVSVIERKINDLKDNSSIYENPSFSSHLKQSELKEKLGQLNRLLN